MRTITKNVGSLLKRKRLLIISTTTKKKWVDNFSCKGIRYGNPWFNECPVVVIFVLCSITACAIFIYKLCAFLSFQFPRLSFVFFLLAVVPRASGLTIKKINATTVLARWNPISKGQVWGVLVGYHVHLQDYYSGQLLQTNKTNETSILLKDLKEWLRYRMQVYGYTSTNTGSSSYYYFYTSKYMFTCKQSNKCNLITKKISTSII